jgi:hypothetical protein
VESKASSPESGQTLRAPTRRPAAPGGPARQLFCGPRAGDRSSSSALWLVGAQRADESLTGATPFGGPGAPCGPLERLASGRSGLRPQCDGDKTQIVTTLRRRGLSRPTSGRQVSPGHKRSRDGRAIQMRGWHPYMRSTEGRSPGGACPSSVQIVTLSRALPATAHGRTGRAKLPARRGRF